MKNKEIDSPSTAVEILEQRILEILKYSKEPDIQTWIKIAILNAKDKEREQLLEKYGEGYDEGLYDGMYK